MFKIMRHSNGYWFVLDKFTGQLMPFKDLSYALLYMQGETHSRSFQPLHVAEVEMGRGLVIG